MKSDSSQDVTAATAGALLLADWGVLRAQGEDAAQFLHGQLTQDTALQTPAQARLAGYCSPKGRLLATMLVFKHSADELLLALPAALLPATLKRLSMFVLRAKCRLSEAGAAQQGWRVWGLAGAAAADWLGAALPGETWAVGRRALGDAADAPQALVARLPDAATADGPVLRCLMLAPADAPAPALPPLDAEQWRWLEVQSGLAWVQPATVEAFVPQMLNLELLGGVNFKKGCYPGQEVVARSQYRGTLKRRTLMFAIEGAGGDTAAVGQEIFHSEDPEQPAGLVAAVGQREGQVLLLAETKLAALEGGSLHLGSADGPLLQPRALPYALTEPQ